MPKLSIPGLGRRTEPAEPVAAAEPVEVTESTEVTASTEVAEPELAEPEVAEPAAVELADDEVIEIEAALEPEADSEPEPEPEPDADVEPEAEAEANEKPETTTDDEVVEAEIVEEPAPSPKSKSVTKKKSRTGADIVLRVEGLTKRFDETIAVDSIDLEVPVGAFYGIVGPNGAGKTTTLSMITGLLRPDSGTVTVHDADVWSDPVVAKRNMGVLPDRLRLFDRLTGAQLLHYAGVLRGLDGPTVRERTADLASAFALEDALGRLVNDYSAGMTKKIALAAAMIHSPRLLVLDEPFESVDPVSAATVTDILKAYVKAGGTVLLSSHSMDLVQRICDHVAVVVEGQVLADGTVDEVRDGQSLEERFVALAGGRKTVEGLEWLHSFSD